MYLYDMAPAPKPQASCQPTVPQRAALNWKRTGRGHRFPTHVTHATPRHATPTSLYRIGARSSPRTGRPCVCARARMQRTRVARPRTDLPEARTEAPPRPRPRAKPRRRM